MCSRQGAKKESLNFFLKKEEKYVRRVIRFSVETKIFEYDIVCKIGKNNNIKTDNILQNDKKRNIPSKTVYEHFFVSNQNT